MKSLYIVVNLVRRRLLFYKKYKLQQKSEGKIQMKLWQKSITFTMALALMIFGRSTPTLEANAQDRAIRSL